MGLIVGGERIGSKHRGSMAQRQGGAAWLRFHREVWPGDTYRLEEERGNNVRGMWGESWSESLAQSVCLTLNGRSIFFFFLSVRP